MIINEEIVDLLKVVSGNDIEAIRQLAIFGFPFQEVSGLYRPGCQEGATEMLSDVFEEIGRNKRTFPVKLIFSKSDYDGYAAACVRSRMVEVRIPRWVDEEQWVLTGRLEE